MNARFLVSLAVVALATGATGCSGCIRWTVAADPATSVLNYVGSSPEMAYPRMSTRYRMTHSEAALTTAVLALPHVRELEFASANDVDFQDQRHATVTGTFDTKERQLYPFTATVIQEDDGMYRCDSLTVGGTTVR